jgi:hypothetical protein
MEVWKDIPGYEGKYQVSNHGRVKSLPKIKGRGIGYVTSERIIRHSINSRGYCNIILCKNGKTETFALHRLVAENFIDNAMNLPEVDHKDRNKANNRADNLRWATRVDNNSNRQVGLPVVCVETGSVFGNAAVAGKMLGLQATSITACCKNRPYHHTCGGYHWKYCEKIAG